MRDIFTIKERMTKDIFILKKDDNGYKLIIKKINSERNINDIAKHLSNEIVESAIRSGSFIIQDKFIERKERMLST